MLEKSSDQSQRDLFNPLLSGLINMNHELVLLSKKTDWSYFEKEFSCLYSHKSQPAMLLHLMAECLLLKRIYNLRPLQNTDFRSNSKSEEKLNLQFTAVNEEFDFFDNAEVAFEKVLCKSLKLEDEALAKVWIRYSIHQKNN